jgi:hypothetical protein
MDGISMAFKTDERFKSYGMVDNTTELLQRSPHSHVTTKSMPTWLHIESGTIPRPRFPLVQRR